MADFSLAVGAGEEVLNTSGPFEHSLSDPSVASVLIDAADARRYVVTGLRPGKARLDLTTCFGERLTYDIEVI